MCVIIFSLCEEEKQKMKVTESSSVLWNESKSVLHHEFVQVEKMKTKTKTCWEMFEEKEQKWICKKKKRKNFLQATNENKIKKLSQ